MDMSKEVWEIVDETDERPTCVLGYRAPAKAFIDEPLNLQTKQGCRTSNRQRAYYTNKVNYGIGGRQ